IEDLRASPDKFMKKLLSCTLLCLLAACAGTPPGPSGTQTGAAPAGEPDLVAQPLRVPELAQLRETPARPLAGRFQAVGWEALPGWSADDLADVWKAFINNCKGLMRPVSGSLAQPARATP